jgi:hypothetical protein
VAESYVGRVEHAASGSTRVEIDDLDSPNWIGTPVGPHVVNANAPDVWEVGIILLEGPRAWQYATANQIARRSGDEGVTVRFEGTTAFAPVLSAGDVSAAQERIETLRQQHARMRMQIPPEDDTPIFENPSLSILQRPRRVGDDPPDLYPGRPNMRPNTSRLALDHGGTQLYIGEGTRDDSISLQHCENMGGGLFGFPRSVLAEHGAAISSSWGSGRRGVSVHGVIPDEVIAVQVNGQHAVMGENVFLVVLDDDAVLDNITLTTATGEHEIRYGPPPEL